MFYNILIYLVLFAWVQRFAYLYSIKLNKQLKHTIMKATTEVQKFLHENISTEPYQLLKFSISEYYPKLVIDFSTVSESVIKKAENDLKLFEEAENARLKIERILVGDYIRLKNGELTKVGCFTCDGQFQDTKGGSFHIGRSGYGSYSGGFAMNVYNVSDFEFSGEYKSLKCWVFSGHSSGGNRGVYSEIKVKIWNEK